VNNIADYRPRGGSRGGRITFIMRCDNVTLRAGFATK
jgi:hypothetical protein